MSIDPTRDPFPGGSYGRHRYIDDMRGSLMAKAKRKITPTREPNGRLSRSTAIAIGAVSPAQVKRLRDAAARGMADPLWGTQLGRLFLEAKITAPQFEAGKRWGRLINRWHGSIEAPRPYPGEGPLAYMGTVRARDMSEDPPIDTPEGKKIAEYRMNLADDVLSAEQALIAAGMLAERAVRATCEENESPVGAFGLANLQNGLTALATHWGIGP